MIPLLLAAQAAGMIFDAYGTGQQIKMGRMGADLEKASINTNIQMNAAAAANQSVYAMQNLRQVMGSQAAIFAARGTRGNAGSAFSFNQESVSKFGSDEQARRMNQLSREAELRANMVLTGMHQLTSETQLGKSLTGRLMNKIPTSPDAWAGIGKSLGFGMTSAT